MVQQMQWSEVANTAPGGSGQWQAGHLGEMPCHDVTFPPCSFLRKKWKNICVGDVVCLSKDSIVPVSPPPNLEHPGGGSSGNPDSSFPTPG